MKTPFKSVVLSNRQFVGLLLTLFSLASIIAAALLDMWPREDTEARWQADFENVTTFGFLPPAISSILIAVVAATAFLAVVNLWLSLRDREGSDFTRRKGEC